MVWFNENENNRLGREFPKKVALICTATYGICIYYNYNLLFIRVLSIVFKGRAR